MHSFTYLRPQAGYKLFNHRSSRGLKFECSKTPEGIGSARDHTAHPSLSIFRRRCFLRRILHVIPSFAPFGHLVILTEQHPFQLYHLFSCRASLLAVSWALASAIGYVLLFVVIFCSLQVDMRVPFA